MEYAQVVVEAGTGDICRPKDSNHCDTLAHILSTVLKRVPYLRYWATKGLLAVSHDLPWSNRASNLDN